MPVDPLELAQEKIKINIKSLLSMSRGCCCCVPLLLAVDCCDTLKCSTGPRFLLGEAHAPQDTQTVPEVLFLSVLSHTTREAGGVLP